MFALSVLPLALAVGIAVDYSRATDARTALLMAADAAALSALTPNALTLGAADAQSDAVRVFNSHTARFASNVSTVVDVRDVPATGRSVLVTFQADVPTSVLRIAGWSTVSVGGMSKAASPRPTYIDFYVLLDNTPSMGVGATAADINTMVANTSDKCAFACHDLSAGSNDYYSLAKRIGVTMRIDVVRSATQQLMDTATSSAVTPGQYRAAIYLFGQSCGSAGPATISSLTSNLSAAKTSASNIDLMTVPYQNYNNDQCTDLTAALAGLNSLVPTPGDGNTSTAPQKVIFLVSDGVADAYYPSNCSRPTTGGRCQEPIKLASCQALKDRGIKVAVLYTTYLPLPTNSWYNTWIAPFASTIPTQMERCASPGLYFQVSPTEGIADALKALFKKSVEQARLNQ